MGSVPKVSSGVVEVEPPDPPRLVDAAWLQEHGGDAGVLVVDVGVDAAAYFEGHIPGAVSLAWLDDLHDPHHRGVPSQQRWEHVLGRRGITADTHLVLYGEQDNVFAAYAYWLLCYYRHANVSLLDGGRRAWIAAGGRLVEASREPAAARYRSRGPDPDLRASRDLLLERFVDAPVGNAIVDCRRPQEFAGRPDSVVDLPVLRHRLGGHVPGARNLPHSELLDARTGCFEPRTVLLDRVAGLAASDDIVVYCNVGERSSLSWFVLHELLGYPRVRVYDGGWAEYGSLTEAPVAR
jgi:thiosulfate/3-mercaptopyruvate sulfurtransferase